MDGSHCYYGRRRPEINSRRAEGLCRRSVSILEEAPHMQKHPGFCFFIGAMKPFSKKND